MSITPTTTALLDLVVETIGLRLSPAAMSELSAHDLEPLRAPGVIGAKFSAVLLGEAQTDGTRAAYLARIGIVTTDLATWRVRVEALSEDASQGWGVLVDHGCDSLPGACDLVAAVAAPGVADRVGRGDWIGEQHLTPAAA